MNKLDSLLKFGGILGLVLTMAFLLIVGPICLVWGLNLIGLAVPFTFKTLFGSFLIMLVIRGGSTTNKN